MATTNTKDPWRSRLDKILWFLDHASQEKKLELKDTPTQTILMELVSASTLGIPAVDPYCVVFLNDHEVHRTKAIQNDPDPIWTVETNSLCLVDIPLDDGDNLMKIEVNHGYQCLGIVSIKCCDILKKNGAREEFIIRKTLVANDEGEADDNNIIGKPLLALRFRKASPNDICFFRPPERTLAKDRASDINFHYVNMKTKKSQKKSVDENNHTTRFRIQPYPNPADVENTTWMTKEEVNASAIKPSMNWVEAGYGDMGMIYIEVIGCDKLTNMDVGLSEKTDAFVALVFEDAMVRTDIMHDLRSPRWMPWSTRAFAFRVCHPSSIIMLGVFDYDQMPISDHDPIGRVVINTVNFKNNTCYNLIYRLHDDPLQQDDRGTIRLRLRVEWKDEALALRASFIAPPRFLINVESQKSLSLLRYICRGRVNMEVATVDSVKFYANELMSYGPVYCYVIDVCLNIWLWRGRAELTVPFLNKKLSVWFPIQSIVVLTAAVFCIEVPTMIPAIFLYSVAWILFSVNYHGSKHPNPWTRCVPCHETNMIVVTGKSRHAPIFINENEGVKDATALKALDKVKAERVVSFFTDTINVALKVQKIYKKTQIEGIAIDTEDKSWSLMGNHLYYLHLVLGMACTYLRMGRNFVNWRGYYTHNFTMTCVIGATMWLILPMNSALVWLLRVLVWAFLGPWIKLVDIYCIHPHYRTKEELLQDPTFHGTNLDQVLTSESLQKMGASARLASEEALKLKAMREHEFGKLSQLIPAIDTCLVPHIPLPQSTAEPYLGSICNSSLKGGFVDLPKEAQSWRYVPGQHLGGNMVHRRLKQGDMTVQLASTEDVAVNF